MAQPLSSTKIDKSFFHGLSKVQTESTQYTFESKYKSSHSITNQDVWIDTVPYAVDVSVADNNVVLYPTIIKKYTKFALTEVPGSNGEAWYINDSKFIRPFISPVDIPNKNTNEPSFGYEVKLYKDDGTLITSTTGVWFVDYYAGIVLFEKSNTPSVLGYGIPKITCYAYIGRSGTTNGFSKIQVEGQNDIATSVSEGTLKLIQGDNITIETDVNNTSVRISSIVDLSHINSVNVVKGFGLNEPPSDAAENDSYVIGTSPTSAWISHENEIASIISGLWTFEVPKANRIVFDILRDKMFVYDGIKWIIDNSIEIVDDDTTLNNLVNNHDGNIAYTKHDKMINVYEVNHWKKYRFINSITDLGDVDTTSLMPTDGQALTWDATSSQWKPKTIIPTPQLALDDLTDVELGVMPTSGQTLVWDAFLSIWKPGTLVTTEASINIVDDNEMRDGIVTPSEGQLTFTKNDDLLNYFDGDKWQKYIGILAPQVESNWVLIKEYNLNNQGVDETIPWDGDYNPRLRIECNSGVASTANSRFLICPNGDTIANNYGNTGFSTNGGFISGISYTSSEYFSVGELNLKSQTYKKQIMFYAGFDLNTNDNITQIGTSFHKSISKVTSIRFMTDSPTFNGNIKIYKWTDIKTIDLQSYELVKEYNLYNKQLNDTFSWDGEADDYIFIKLVGSNMGRTHIRINNDTGNSSYFFNDNSAGYDTSSIMIDSFMVHDIAAQCNSYGNLKAGNVSFISTCGMDSSSSVKTSYSRWKNTSTKVSSLTVYSDAPITGVIQIYKLVKTHMICSTPDWHSGLYLKYIDSNNVQVQPGSLEINGIIHIQSITKNISISLNLAGGETEKVDTLYYLYAISNTSIRIPDYKFSSVEPTIDRLKNATTYQDCKLSGIGGYHPTFGVNWRCIGKIANDSSKNFLLSSMDSLGTHYFGTNSIDGLSDVDTTTITPDNGDVLIWNMVSSQWKPYTLDINHLSDVDTVTISPTNGQALVWNTSVSKWNPVALNINHMSDVDTVTTNPTNGQALLWDSTSSQWKPGTVIPTPILSINALTDVDTVTITPTNGQVLLWDSTSSQWKPGSVVPTPVLAIDDLTDVDTTTSVPTNGQGLIWSSILLKWKPQSINLDLLTDVDTVTLAPTNNQSLIWDSTSSQWKPKTVLISVLGDVDTTTVAPTNGQALVWNTSSSKWKPGTLVTSLKSLSDVDTTTVAPTNGQALLWEASSSKWKPGVIVTSLKGLTDVDATTVAPTNGQGLIWDSTASKWKPGDVASSSLSINDLNDVDTVTLLPTNNQSLLWDSASSQWKPKTIIIGLLTDVDTTTVAPTNGQGLIWNTASSKWKPGNVVLKIDDLNDVDTTVAPTNNQALVWNSTSSQWKPKGINIDLLTDVDTTTLSPTNGQTLVWDASTSQWKPGNAASGGAICVNSVGLNTPPTSPVNGDKYIIGISPTGMWASYAKYLVEYSTGTGWIYTAPSSNQQVLDVNINKYFLYKNSIWTLLTGINDVVDTNASLNNILSPIEGQLAFTKNDDLLNYYDGSKWQKYVALQSPQVLSNFVLIEQKDFNNEIVNFIIDNVNGDLDKQYYIEVSGTSLSSSCVISLVLNGDSSSNYKLQYLEAGYWSNANQSGSGAGLISSSSMWLGRCGTSGVVFTQAYLDSVSGKKRMCKLNSAVNVGQTESYISNRSITWENSSANITSLTISSDYNFTGTIKVYKYSNDLKAIDLHSYELVKEYNFASAQIFSDTLSWNGEIDTDCIVKINGEMGASGFVGCYLNGDATSNYTYNYILRNQTILTSGYNTYNQMYLTDGSTGILTGVSNIYLQKGRYRTFTTQGVRYASTHTYEAGGGCWLNTIDSVTSITFFSSAAFKGNIRIYKLVKTHMINSTPDWHVGLSLSYIDSNNVQVSSGGIEINGLIHNQSIVKVPLTTSLRNGETKINNTVYYLYAVYNSSTRNSIYKFSYIAPAFDRFKNTFTYDDCKLTTNGCYHGIEGSPWRCIGKVALDSSGNIISTSIDSLCIKKYVLDINTLTDVDTMTVAPTNGQGLIWNTASSQWKPGNVVLKIDDLSDVDTTVAPTNDQALIWNSTLSQWKPKGINIDLLTDVDTTTYLPTNGQALVWDSTISQWKPGNVANGGMNYKLINSAANVSLNDYLMCDTSLSSFIITLPGAASMGDMIYILDIVKTFNIRNVILNPNGLKIDGDTTNVALDTVREYRLIYTTSVYGWRIL